ncbi:hypothetical protein ABTD55_22825, partial [Acinetobacter baumannii]
RSVNARRIDGESFWQDVDTGAHLVFMVDGEKRICFFQLQEIQQCALNPLLQRQLSERLNIEVQKLPSPFQVDGNYNLSFYSN